MNIYLGESPPRPSPWRRRSAGSIAAHMLTAIGFVAVCTLLWLALLKCTFWLVALVQ